MMLGLGAGHFLSTPYTHQLLSRLRAAPHSPQHLQRGRPTHGAQGGPGSALPRLRPLVALTHFFAFMAFMAFFFAGAGAAAFIAFMAFIALAIAGAESWAGAAEEQVSSGGATRGRATASQESESRALAAKEKRATLDKLSQQCALPWAPRCHQLPNETLRLDI